MSDKDDATRSTVDLPTESTGVAHVSYRLDPDGVDVSGADVFGQALSGIRLLRLARAAGLSPALRGNIIRELTVLGLLGPGSGVIGGTTPRTGVAVAQQGDYASFSLSDEEREHLRQKTPDRPPENY